MKYYLFSVAFQANNLTYFGNYNNDSDTNRIQITEYDLVAHSN